jgi:hypothetical protein
MRTAVVKAKAPATQIVKDVLAPEILRHGFERVPGPWFSFARTLDDGRHQLVDVEHPAYMNILTVSLQEKRADGTQRHRRLEDFAGLKDYELGSGSADEIRRAVTEAADHFRIYALRWFDDAAFTTPAASAIEGLVRDAAYARHIQQGRERFKRADYASALEAFRAAESIKPLDPTTQKFRELALKNSRRVRQ